MGLITTGFVILVILISGPALVMAQTSIEDLGHSWSDNYFAIVADVNQPKDNSIHLVSDITPDYDNPMLGATDVNEAINNQFFLSYINQSGMEVGYLALGTVEKTTGLRYNRTAPFQALFTHFASPTGADVFVVINFDGLLAYSGGGLADRRLDPADEIYLGISGGGQGLTALINGILALAGVLGEGMNPADVPQIPKWDVTPFFERTAGGYSFGVTYHNLLVTWLSLTEPEDDYTQLGQNLSGPKIKAVSLFNSITYRYNVSFDTDPETGMTRANIAANYDFGSTDLIGIAYDNNPDAIDPEEEVRAHLENLRDERGLTGHVINLTPKQPQSTMVYSGDLAKLRIHGPRDETPGLGLAVINSANIITIGETTIEKDGKALDPNAEGEVGSVAMLVDGQKAFESDYKTKNTYDLVLANGTTREDLPVYNTIIPANRPGFNVPYFVVQRLVMVPWLLLIANELRTQATTQDQITAEHYFLATQFPAWSGGRIIHDPNFTAYSNPEAGTVTSTEPQTTSDEPMTTSTTEPQVSEFTSYLQVELFF